MRKQKHTYKSKHERQNDIILTAHSMYVDGKKAFTNAKMAKRLGMAASTRLKRYMDALVEEGWLTKTEKIHRNSLMKDGNRLVIKKHEYSLSAKALAALVIL